MIFSTLVLLKKKKIMKKTIKLMTIVFTSLSLTLGLTLTSCKKGDIGPAGPSGTNGVANIQSSTVTTNNLSWLFDNTDNSYSAILTFSAINQSVMDKGTVQVFVGDGTGQEWNALPFSYTNVQFNYSFKSGQVIISVNLSDGSAPSNPGIMQFKIIVIPPAMVNPNVNVKNYTNLKSAYNLAD